MMNWRTNWSTRGYLRLEDSVNAWPQFLVTTTLSKCLWKKQLNRWSKFKILFTLRLTYQNMSLRLLTREYLIIGCNGKLTLSKTTMIKSQLSYSRCTMWLEMEYQWSMDLQLYQTLSNLMCYLIRDSLSCVRELLWTWFVSSTFLSVCTTSFH